MIVSSLVAIAFALSLWRLFGFAMGLRFAKRSRERARLAQEQEGRRVIAEIPLDDDVVFFIEDAASFSWGTQSAARADVIGSRLLLNGGVMATWARPGASLPEPPAAEAYEGGERWDVMLYERDGAGRAVPCGTLREGVSREIASKVFEAIRRSA
jgi:hypothetical protein